MTNWLPVLGAFFILCGILIFVAYIIRLIINGVLRCIDEIKRRRKRS